MVKELKQKLSETLHADRIAVQHEFTPLVLEQILQLLKAGDIPTLLDYMHDINVSNEMVKEHLMTLTLNRDLAHQFDKIETKIKTQFTKEYNKKNQEIKMVVKGKAAKNNDQLSAAISEADENSDSEVSDTGDLLLTEEQIQELKNAKKEEKQQKRAANAQKRLR